MASAINAPRINNNDDEVKVLAFDVGVGDEVGLGQIIGQVETDKAVLDVTAPCAGFVLGFVAAPEEVVRVGSVMLWLGASRDEAVPEPSGDAPAGGQHEGPAVTAKARLLLEKHGLTPAMLPAIEGRITVDAVEAFLAANHQVDAGTGARDAGNPRGADSMPGLDGQAITLTREEKGMAAAVAWHRDQAVPGYIELDYDLEPWIAYAKTMQDEKGWLMSPLLSMMAWRLVEIARAVPRLNATFVAGKRYEFAAVNLGFTIQAGDTLYLAVVRDANRLDEAGFINALGDLQRRAAGHKLREAETCGATVSFSSMERWKVTRHIPILPPQTAMIVAHAAASHGRGVLGATYDHRVLNGAQVVTALRQLSRPQST
jgi:pyruvate dehydrogenase E2 component (dihydrolipoamide acetyltransferase)